MKKPTWNEAKELVEKLMRIPLYDTEKRVEVVYEFLKDKEEDKDSPK